ncbi:Putative SOS response-associated peptidase YedK [Caballeronia peredens]|nr:Putative SOS response-associated peptidase YedK [Caballeronia peredens]
MCGRISQARNPIEYARILEWENAGFPPSDAYRHGYNIAPTTNPLVAYPDGNFRPVRWGYKPFWAREKKMPPAINARVETAAKGPFFRNIFKTGRVIVPADGWYEWIVDEDKKKTPFFIRLKDRKPMCLAGLTSVREEKDLEDPINGFVIVTAASDSGMVDIHDRRPLVFTPQDAKIWLDPDTPVEEADLMAHDAMRPVEDFEWFKVSRDVNNVRNEGEYLIEPV